MKSKSQMEIMGLVVIVILISLIILVVLQFMIKNPASKIKEEYYHSELATNTLNSLLRTTSKDCKGYDMTSLAKDCIENFDSPLICDDGQNSCEYLYVATSQILETSLGGLNKKYNITVADNRDETLMSIGNSPCIGKRESSNPQPLATDMGLMQIVLYICED
jgi:hypothetical protein